MTGISALKAYHQAHKKALELHYRWEEFESTELLELFEKFRPLADEAIEATGEGWSRRANIKQHLGFMSGNLKNGKKELSKTDIDDLIYADFPAMLDHIVRAMPELAD